MDKKLILFDFDGVLIDSKANMERSWSAVCKHFSINIEFKEYLSQVGKPFGQIMKHLSLSDHDKKIEKFYHDESLKNIHLVEFYPGVKEYLKYLLKEGYLIGIVTSKDKIRTEMILSSLDFNFHIISTPNKKYRGKPAPDQLLSSISKMNVDPKQSVFIGDAIVDYYAAMRAQVDFIFADWGYGVCDSCKNRIKNINEVSIFL
jgi:phosphoglycolate phosphatase